MKRHTLRKVLASFLLLATTIVFYTWHEKVGQDTHAIVSNDLQSSNPHHAESLQNISPKAEHVIPVYKPHRRTTKCRNPRLFSDTGMMTINSVGRLGNLMCEYAILSGLANINHRQPFMEPLMAEKLLPHFRLTMPVMSNKTFSDTKWDEFLVSGVLQPKHYHLKQRHLRLTEYPASWTYFHPHLHDVIRHEFTFHDYWKDIANKALAEIVTDGKPITFIGVHVRRGDYVSYMKDRKGVVADKGYFDEAMKRFRIKFSNAAFVVVSNDMKWCKDNMDNSSGDVFLIGNGNEESPGRDMAILAHCNHSIITLGTFGFWAAYLAGGETIYLTNFTTPDSYYSHMYSSGAYFLTEWHGISANLAPLFDGNSTIEWAKSSWEDFETSQALQ